MRTDARRATKSVVVDVSSTQINQSGGQAFPFNAYALPRLAPLHFHNTDPKGTDNMIVIKLESEGEPFTGNEMATLRDLVAKSQCLIQTAFIDALCMDGESTLATKLVVNVTESSDSDQKTNS